MAEELKLINANSREDANLSPLSKIEIYSFSIHSVKSALNCLRYFQNYDLSINNI